MPTRIQRKRSKGWKCPKDAVYVGRQTRWGNPFKVVDVDGKKQKYVIRYRAGAVEHRIFRYPVSKRRANELAVLLFRWYVEDRPDLIRAVKARLRGRNLVCWCALEEPCHADVLLEIANAEERS